MKFYTVLIILSISSILHSQVPALYTGGEYPCNGKDLWAALKIDGCSDGSCSEYKNASAVTEKECSGGKRIKKSPEITTEVPPPTSSSGSQVGNETSSNLNSYCGNRGMFIGNDNQYFKIKYCEIKSSSNRDICNCNENSIEVISNEIETSKIMTNNVMIDFIPIVKYRSSAFNSNNEIIPFSCENSTYNWSVSGTDEIHNYNFKFIVPGQEHCWLLNEITSIPIKGLNSSLFKSIGNVKEKDKIKSFLYKIALVAAEDPNFSIVEGYKPTRGNPRAIVTGTTYHGVPYLIGIDWENDFYNPIKLTNVDLSRSLIKSFRKGDLRSHPFTKILDSFYHSGKQETIVACVQGGQPKKYKNPNEAWDSGVNKFTGSGIRDLKVITDEGRILGNGFRNIESSEFEKIKKANFLNPYLYMLFVADPHCKILDIHGKKIALLTGDSKNLFVLNVFDDNSRPIVKALLNMDTATGNEKTKNEYLLQYAKDSLEIHPTIVW